MNKTVNINLAGIFFHVDENAYLKLQRYLDAIKRSFTDSQGRDEIISDIEARIAELFSEKIKDERQVIGMKEVDEVIEVMGQPEDYRIDEEIFEDEPKASSQTKNTKQLFRDTTNSYVGGVSSGLGHYLGIDPIWIRLAWILFTVFSSGAFILIYIAFWLFVPEAKTTADFLAMKGEAVNISNIEKKIKEGFNDVADKVKDVDYQKYGNKVKSSSTTFFEALGDVALTLFKIFVKFVGVFLLILAGATLIGLFFGLFTVGTFDFVDTGLSEHIGVANMPEAPLWLLSLLCFFAIGIPFFFLFILGLKILITNLKSIGTPAKISLLAVWIAAVFGLVFLGIKQATQEAFDAQVITQEKVLPVAKNDTLNIQMVRNTRYINTLRRGNEFSIRRDENDNKVIVIKDVQVFFRASSRDTVAKISIEKKADGSSYEEAKKRAEDIIFGYEVSDNTLLINGYALTDYANKYRDQEVKVIITLPEGMTIYPDNNTRRYNNSWSYDDYLVVDRREGNYLQLVDGKLLCSTCEDEAAENNWKYNEDKDGIHINISDSTSKSKVKIDKKGLEIKNEEVDIKIDKNGVNIKSEN
ncbi:PspC domain-containing protein [Aquimarina brevivitae]|uniref:Phage shock protein C (PspC) family protein n=1 Tax=Aquimarina brevivitae TaxID=323412 RepID=A0A4Q7P0U5_9FLAO|nr:PspC domain-containing protein [Aquimarina brevivitae]RZS93315.1 phage shock protein C (PspC) family protein [Aquimarina brevivitae]